MDGIEFRAVIVDELGKVKRKIISKEIEFEATKKRREKIIKRIENLEEEFKKPEHAFNVKKIRQIFGDTVLVKEIIEISMGIIRIF